MTKQTVKNIPLSQIVPDPMNVRAGTKYDPEAIEKLAATIGAQGLKQSLLVRPGDGDDKGKFLATAGGRRWLALQKLVAGKVIAEDFGVPCVVVKMTDEEAREASLTENIEREQMTPVQQFRAWKHLHDGGATVADIAARFGVTEKLIQQRLALADLHPNVLKMLEADQITLSAAASFTLGSKKQQAEYAKDAVTWQLREHEVRKAMVGAKLSSNSWLANSFIGEDAYREAGGKIEGDLFGDDSFWISNQIVDKLTAQRFAEFEAAKKAEGWAFVLAMSDYKEANGNNRFWNLDRFHPVRVDLSEEDQKRAEELAEQLNALEDEPETPENQARWEELDAAHDAVMAKSRAFKDEQKATSGVVIDMKDGQIWEGVQDPSIVKPWGSGKDGASTAASEPKDPLAISAALSGRLSNAMQAGLADAIQKPKHQTAAIAVIAASIHAALNGKSGPQVVSGDWKHADREDGRGFAELFAEYVAMDAKALYKAMAALAARVIDVSDAHTYGNHGEAIAALVETFDPDALPHFDADDYSRSVGKPVLIAAITDIRNGEKCGELEKVKKVHLAEQLRIEVGGEYRPEGKKWLPPQLRVPSYAGPVYDPEAADEASESEQEAA